jgi:putative transposase
MSAKRFSPGKQFYWQKEIYQVRRLLPENNLVIDNLQTAEMQIVALDQLVKALFAGELRFTDSAPADEKALADYIDLSDCPERLRSIAEYRLKVIQPLLDLAPHQRKKAIKMRIRSLKAAREDNERSLNTALSVASVYRWIDEYTISGGDIRSLIPNTEKRGGVKQSRLEPETDAIIQDVIETHYLRREKRTIDHLHREVAVRVDEENRIRVPAEELKTPSRSTIARRIDALDEEKKLTARRGKKAAKRELSHYGETAYPMLPLERVEIDHTRADIIVIDDQDLLPLGRLTLTYCIDTATRYPLGYYLGFEPPSYLTVMECLYHAICPKGDIREQYGTEHDWQIYGIPYTLVIDNGKEFIGQDLEDACNLLGIILQNTPVMTPHFKAAVERMFGTLNTGLLHTLPGTTFSNVGQRSDYDSLKQACISLSELDKMMHIFLLDIYAENFHRGVQGIPARLWEQATEGGFFPRMPPSVEELLVLLGRVAYRTVQPYGIELNCLRYNCSELVPLRTRLKKRDNKRVKIKYNPSDLGHIQVYDPDEKRHLQVPALAQEYAQGLSLWKHKVIRNFALAQQRTVDIVALGRAQRKIQEIVQESMERKKLGTRSKIARWRGNGGRVDAQEGDGVTAGESTTELTGEDIIAPALCFTELDLDSEKLEEEGWRVSYDLPFVGEGEEPDVD